MNYITQGVKYLQRTFTLRSRIYILWGIVGVIIVYFIGIIVFRGTLEQGQIDWGVDQGYTQFFWGIVAVVVILAVLSWPTVRKYFKSRALDRVHLVLFSSSFFFIFIIVVTFQFWTHDQTINFYHKAMAVEESISSTDFNVWSYFDKVGHFMTALVLVIFLLYTFPRKEWIIIAWAFVNLFELFEIMVIYNLYMIDSTAFGVTHTLDALLYEIGDATMDIVFNTAGIITGTYLATKIPFIKKRLR